MTSVNTESTMSLLMGPSRSRRNLLFTERGISVLTLGSSRRGIGEGSIVKVLIDWRLWDHPKLYAVARLLGRNPTEAGGYLARLWGATAEYRADGSLSGLTDAEIARVAGWQGTPAKFCKALRKVGWLDGTEVHDWQEHQGKYIEKLLAERARKKREYQAGKSKDTPGSLRGESGIPSPSPSPSPSPGPVCVPENGGNHPPSPDHPSLRSILDAMREASWGGTEEQRETEARGVLAAGVRVEEAIAWVRDHPGRDVFALRKALVPRDDGGGSGQFDPAKWLEKRRAANGQK
jgi:hypothetical protein